MIIIRFPHGSDKRDGSGMGYRFFLLRMPFLFFFSFIAEANNKERVH
jgi:hypothetical protein